MSRLQFTLTFNILLFAALWVGETVGLFPRNLGNGIYSVLLAIEMISLSYEKREGPAFETDTLEEDPDLVYVLWLISLMVLWTGLLFGVCQAAQSKGLLAILNLAAVLIQSHKMDFIELNHIEDGSNDDS